MACNEPAVERRKEKANAEAGISGEAAPAPQEQVDPQKRAEALARSIIILDGHVDLPYRLDTGRGEAGALTEDISVATEKGDFDFPRARFGGLDAPFMSIYVPAKYEGNGAKDFADKLITMVEGLAKKWPEKFALATSPAEIEANFSARKISLPLGMENGAPIEGKLENVAHFYKRGIRYITLAHSKDNHIADSSYDDRHTNKGLSEFGKKVVVEMNRLGIMVDVSHLSDEAFWGVMETSQAPSIASHSSCRHFTPGFERNMSDEMIRALAKKGGVIQINFGSGFIDSKIQKQNSKLWAELTTELKKKGLEFGQPKSKPIVEAFKKAHPTDFATTDQVADHIDHVVKLVGVDHVGFGSDFDGVGDSLPTGLKDAAAYPNLIRVLLERGYSEADIRKVAATNVLRVWAQVDLYAAQQVASATGATPGAPGAGAGPSPATSAPALAPALAPATTR